VNENGVNVGEIPTWVASLQSVFGPPSDAGFGSAVFYSPPGAGTLSLEAMARIHYERFCGERWTELGGEQWLGVWRQLYDRPAGQPGAVLSEIPALVDPEVRSAALMLWEGGPEPTAARAALQAAFDATIVEKFHIYKIGDGEAMSGAILAAETMRGEQCCLIILLD
jgi:hypothetical protein